MADLTNFIIIGICGTTNGGKSTTAEKLKKLFPHAKIMVQDKYFLEPGHKKLKILNGTNFINWDELNALDMDKMVQDVDAWKAASSASGCCPFPLLIIEGFLILNHSVLATYFHKKYFLTIDKETCIKRRRHRTYNPPDVPGYFEEVVWPMYLIHKEAISSQSDIVYLDGTKHQDNIVQRIACDIQELMTKCQHFSSLHS